MWGFTVIFAISRRKTTFEEWTTKNILQPLGMTRSGFGTPAMPNMAPVPMLPMDFGWFGPAGDMYSTLDDLTKLGRMFTQPGKQTLFKVSILKMIFKALYEYHFVGQGV